MRVQYINILFYRQNYTNKDAKCKGENILFYREIHRQRYHPSCTIVVCFSCWVISRLRVIFTFSSPHRLFESRTNSNVHSSSIVKLFAMKKAPQPVVRENRPRLIGVAFTTHDLPMSSMIIKFGFNKKSLETMTDWGICCNH